MCAGAVDKEEMTGWAPANERIAHVDPDHADDPREGESRVAYMPDGCLSLGGKTCLVIDDGAREKVVCSNCY